MDTRDAFSLAVAYGQHRTSECSVLTVGALTVGDNMQRSLASGKMLSCWMMMVLMISLTWAWQETWSRLSGVGMSVGPKHMARLGHGKCINPGGDLHRRLCSSADTEEEKEDEKESWGQEWRDERSSTVSSSGLAASCSVLDGDSCML
ncbi:hypothetical protein EYF80_021753 [Liparis tanakae]|uniref:Uncharacterized protein n=1 Tax=Liparis tanakae TaxID=230148 RepID=A0A4Z2HQV9_9TELE|nr:hypothetical protein EYF80_021753 [Liparis tanakae]